MARKKKKSLDQLRKEAIRLTQKGLVARTKRAIRNIPETSTRFQLELDIAARKASAKETKRLKKAIKKKGRKALHDFIRGLRNPSS